MRRSLFVIIKLFFDLCLADRNVLSMQTFEGLIRSICHSNPNYEWDDYGTLYTDAFWKLQYEAYEGYVGKDTPNNLDYDYIDEIVACLLGGFGFKAEQGWAAFNRLKSRNLIKPGMDYDSLVSALSEPLCVGSSTIHYRFPRQKARYVSDFLGRSDLFNPPLDNDLKFRSWLMTINGIGPKTASWITRNYLRSDNVAIVDIHLYRAGVLTGFIDPMLDIEHDYFEIENCFLSYCKTLAAKPSIMDIVMWTNMKHTNRIALSLINKK